MSNRRVLALAMSTAALAAITLLHHLRPVGAATTTSHPQIATFSVSADQTLVWPSAAPSPYLVNLPDEHTTVIPPASSSAPYLLWGGQQSEQLHGRQRRCGRAPDD